MAVFPTGKLPEQILRKYLSRVPGGDPAVLIRGAPGEDAAVLDTGGGKLLLVKSDPVTFAADRPGWYAVQINANDIATLGGRSRWFLATLLLPEAGAEERLVSALFEEIIAACSALEVELIGGHTEITHGLARPIVCGAMLGEVSPERLCRKENARPGDRILLSKKIAVEGTALLAREFTGRLAGNFSAEKIERAARYLYEPGISVVREAELASATGHVRAMHDPTEGGLATALHELAAATGQGVAADLSAVPLYEETREFCAWLGLDPLGLIASGSLLIICDPAGAREVNGALSAAGIVCTDIGELVPREAGASEIIKGGSRPLLKFERDEICRLF